MAEDVVQCIVATDFVIDVRSHFLFQSRLGCFTGTADIARAAIGTFSLAEILKQI